MTFPSDAEDRFRRLYAEAYPDVLRFVQRRTGPDQAEDVAAEAFVVVWRRMRELPTTQDHARAWLFGIARNCLLNDHRAQRRRAAATIRVAHGGAAMEGFDEGLVHRLDVAAAWPLLRAEEQEAIALALWDGLDSRQAGLVLGISAQAYRRRLSRARSALRVLLQEPPVTAVHPLVPEAQS